MDKENDAVDFEFVFVATEDGDYGVSVSKIKTISVESDVVSYRDGAMVKYARMSTGRLTIVGGGDDCVGLTRADALSKLISKKKKVDDLELELARERNGISDLDVVVSALRRKDLAQEVTLFQFKASH